MWNRPSIYASRSMNCIPVMALTVRPNVDLPHPIYPIRKIGCIAVKIVYRNANLTNSVKVKCICRRIFAAIVGYFA